MGALATVTATLRKWSVYISLAGQIAAGQVRGRIAIDKHTFAVGEPIAVVFQVSNTGSKLLQLTAGGLYGPCGSPYQIKVNGILVPQLGSAHDIILSCSYGTLPLKPRQHYKESFIITKDRELLKQPGRYHVEVIRLFSYEMREMLPNTRSPVVQFESQFDIVVKR